jgi:hypothetical protein
MADNPTPVILAGQTEGVGNGVIAMLKPEYEGMFSDSHKKKPR